MISFFRFLTFQAWFGLREEWSSLTAGLFGYLLFPLYVANISFIWNRYRPINSSFTLVDLFIYVGLAEVIVMTTLTSLPTDRAMADFSFSLSRPRSWFSYYAGLILGRNLGRRLIYTALFAVTVGLMTAELTRVGEASLRLLLLLFALVAIEVLLSTLWALLQILFGKINYFKFAVLKIIMVLGGVFSPLSEVQEPWRSILLKLPPSDFVFQPAHFALTGAFFNLTPMEWVARVSLDILVLGLISVLLFRWARHNQQIYGG